MIAVRSRRDLIAVAQRWAGRTLYAVKDPAASRYFHFTPEELFVLERLDGRTTAGEIAARFRRAFPGRRLTDDDLTGFVARLDGSGLLAARPGSIGLGRGDAPGKPPLLAAFGRAAGLLAARIPGPNPQAFLTGLYACLWWLFHPAAVAATVTLWVAAVTVVVRGETLWDAVPSVAELLTVRTAVVLFVFFAGMKVLHELAHGLACVHIGGVCREIGLLLVTLFPILYCDVSDNWMEPQRWRRIFVVAAGVAAEVTVAAVAAILWAFARPGPFQTACFQVMLVGAVSTLVVNANPLLRYDGYFILCDLVEIPNLAARSRRRWVGLCRRVLRLPAPPGPQDVTTGWRRAVETVYAPASTLYRVAVLAGLYFALRWMLAAYGLAFLADAAGALMTAGFAMSLVSAAGPILRDRPGGRVRRRSVTAALLTVAAVVALLLWPLPHAVVADGIVRPVDAARIYAARTGRLIETVDVGTRVEAGDVLARLADADLELRKVELRQELTRLNARLDYLDVVRGVDEEAASQIATVRQLARSAEQQLAEVADDLASLVLRSPIAGSVIAPPRTSAETAVATRDPGFMIEGTPLDRANAGMTLRAGDLFCVVGDPDAVEVIGYAREADAELLDVGQAVTVFPSQRPGEVRDAVVTEVAESPVVVPPPELVRVGLMAVTAAGEDESPRPASPHYEVRVRLAADDPVAIRSLAELRIRTPPMSLATRALRFFRRTVLFDPFFEQAGR